MTIVTVTIFKVKAPGLILLRQIFFNSSVIHSFRPFSIFIKCFVNFVYGKFTPILLHLAPAHQNFQ